MPLYERKGGRWACLVDPGECSLKVYVLGEEGRFGETRLYQRTARVRGAV